MSKIICEICGTSYQETAECCPICGCTRDEAILLGEEFSMDEQTMKARNRGGQFAAKKKKEIFDFDEVNAEPVDHSGIEEVQYDEEEDLDALPPRHNTFAVIVLTVLIAVMLLLSGFLFLRYFLPNNQAKEEVPTTMPQIQETTKPAQTNAIPCQSLALTSGTATLSTEGGFFLINVSVYPEDTTDELIYHSADTSIATVDDSGRITAVSEGSTVVYITCGTQQVPCEVVCDFTPETIAPTEAETVASEPETIPETEAPEETEEETVPETTEEEKEPEVTLKLKKTDIILDIGYYTTLQLDCDLDPEDITWSAEHTYIATVDEKGVVTAVGKGITEITAKYGDQEAACIVRTK